MPLQTLSVRLLGEFRVELGEAPVTESLSPRLQDLFAYLLLHRDTTVSRQQLAFLFWPDSTDAQARANIRKLLYRLRKAFPEVDHYLDLDGSTIHWQPDAPVAVDVAAFERRLAAAEATAISDQAQRLAEALALYRGDLLPDFYDDWILARREQLRQHYLEGLDLLAELQEAKREYTTSAATVRRLLQEDPLRESAYRRLMRLQALDGDIAAALHTYHHCATVLSEELGVEPGPATQEAYQRLLQRTAPAPAPPAESRGTAPPMLRQLPLVGREEEWQQLLGAWRAAAAGHAQLLLISGEAGIGKTRLAEELLSWARHQGLAVLATTCFAGGGSLPYAPLAGLLRAEAAQQRLPALAPRWRSELARILPELLVADPDLEMPRPLTEAWQQQHLFLALAEAVLAAGEPLLLFLDDLHWADGHTLSWLHYLARYLQERQPTDRHSGGRQSAGRRLLLLATVRSEELVPGHPLLAWQAELVQRLPVGTIRLESLDATATTALASRLLGDELGAEVGPTLYEETEGNPLFAVEMARAGLKRSASRLPDRVRSVIELRLQRLSPQAQEVAGLAAVIGRTFAFPLLAAASPLPEAELIQSLDELWQRQVVREQPEAAYDFSHDKIRQVALARLSPPRRRWWHGQVATALVQQVAGEREVAHGEIAAHWEAAGRPQQAADHYLQAARAATRLYAHEEGARQLQRVLDLLPAGQAQRAQAAYLLAEAQAALGRHTEAAAMLQEVAAEVSDPTAQVRLLARRILALNATIAYAEGRATYREAKRLLAARPAPERDEVEWRAWLDLHLALLELLYFANEPEEMEQICEVMAEPVEAHGTVQQRAEYFAARSRVRFRERRFALTAEEIELARASLHWSRESGDENTIGFRRFALGLSLLWAGRVAEAIAELEPTMMDAERLGNIPLQDRCLAYLCIAYRMNGEVDRVRESVEKLATLAETEGNQNYLGVAEAQRAWLAWRVDDAAAVQAHGETALRLWRPAEGSTYPIHWLARFPMLAAALEAGTVAEAVAHAHAMLAPSQQRLPDALDEALQAAVTDGSRADGQRALQQACRLAQELGYL